MTKRMLIDATHAEETRVVVLDGNRLEDFDVETSTKRQLKGNIYLAKVVRVEPSLQAAFVEYGGNRHGFLAFSEIHPDYYQIPVADRQRLLEMQAEEARLQDEEDDLELALTQAAEHDVPPAAADIPAAADLDVRPWEDGSGQADTRGAEPLGTEPVVAEPPGTEPWAQPGNPTLLASTPARRPVEPTPLHAPVPAAVPQGSTTEPWALPANPRLIAAPDSPDSHATTSRPAGSRSAGSRSASSRPPAQALAIEVETVTGEEIDDTDGYEPHDDQIEALPPPETVGGGEHEGGDDHRERRIPSRFLRNYKIQEVIRRRQIMLVQVVKEERGTKGAALTTYLSLAGRFGVLMPNSPRGGGISRKITSATDRRRLREVIAELDIPRGMGLIVRTAGANRPKPEIKRDCEYLLRLWDDIRDQTMQSVAPMLIYEEASLIKRAIRDVYSRDIDEILVDGEDGWRSAHEFMRMLMPAHAKKVHLWRDGGQPLFARNQVETQLDAMLMPIVQLRSGGYLVINQAEALVAIDVNSGRSTRERNIEETALRTNLEAADEVARQLRLRDLAGLVVIDFIDMESKRHNAMVERRLKEALKNDRARIQVGHISHFGLLEMSRQRLRPSLAETSFVTCPHCGGAGHVRSTESAAIHVLRGIEDEGAKRRSAEIIVHVATPVALYLLNHKRERLREIEIRYGMRVIVAADDSQIAPQFRVERLRTRNADEAPAVISPDRPILVPSVADAIEEDPDVVSSDDEDEEDGEDEENRATDAANGEDGDQRRKRRRRRRRGSRREDQQDDQPADVSAGDVQPDAVQPSALAAETAGEATTDEATADEATADEPAASRATTPDSANGASRSNAVRQDAAARNRRAARSPEVDAATEATPSEAEGSEAEATKDAAPGDEASGDAASGDEAPGRRRGRRGGRRRRREPENELSPFAVPGADQPDLPPVYAGPTPADPFGGQVFDIFDVMERAEQQAVPPRRPAPPPDIVNEGAIEPVPAAAAPQPETMPDTAPGASPEIPSDAAMQANEPTPAAIVEPPSMDASATPPETQPLVRQQPEPPREVVTASADPGAHPPEEFSAPAVETVSAPELPRQEAEAASDGAPEPTSTHQAAEEKEEPAPAEPAIKPILVGAEGEAPAQRKRGWWRR
jgi:ribonuclease E